MLLTQFHYASTYYCVCTFVSIYPIDPWTLMHHPQLLSNSQVQNETEHWNDCLDTFNTRLNEKLHDIHICNDELAAVCTQCTEQGAVASAFISEQVLTIRLLSIRMQSSLNIIDANGRMTPSSPQSIPPYFLLK